MYTRQTPYSYRKHDKCLTRKKSLINHQRVHTGKSSYLSCQCDKCFTQKKNLFKHQIICIGEKLCHYRQFKKCLTQKQKLAENYVNHSEEKPFPCSQCEKAFYFKSWNTQWGENIYANIYGKGFSLRIPPMRRKYILIVNVPLLYGTMMCSGIP